MHIDRTVKAPRLRLTVLGTTDLHGHILNWDYHAGREYADSNGNHIGLAKIASLVHAIRTERGPDSPTLLLDAGDTIQGSPLAYYRARIDPIGPRTVHPMATVMNHLGYDAAVVGNHEFNYGLTHLRRFESQLAFPLLGANVRHAATTVPAFTPYTILEVNPAGAPRPVRVGVLGLTTPGTAIWDRHHVDGVLEFGDVVDTAHRYVAQLRRRGTDLVIVCAHSGMATSSSYGDAMPYPENAATLLAERVAGIDAVLAGHAHVEIAQRFVRNHATGRDVLLTEPLCWGMRLSVIDIEVRYDGDDYEVVRIGSSLLDARTAREDPDVIELISDDHAATVAYVTSPIGECTAEMTLAHATTRHSAVIAWINHVQAHAVAEELRGTRYGELPVLSMTSPFGVEGRIPGGPVTIADIAGVYPVDNYLQAQVLSGADVRAHLEHAAEFFAAAGSADDDPARLGYAVTARTPDGMPDFDFDCAGALNASLSYDIDLARPVGQRISALDYDGRPVEPTERFVVALNSFRASGAAGYPGVRTREPIVRARVEVRQLLIEWVQANGRIDAARFTGPSWRLTYDGRPLGRWT